MPAETSCRIIAVYNQKGGIAKTTSSVNLGVCLAASGARVLVIDLDSQSNATRGLGFEGALQHDLQDLVTGRGAFADAVTPTAFDRLSLLPSSPNLSGIEMRLATELKSQRSLAELIADANPDFDYVLLDCPPAFGLLSANALVAAHAVVIPMTATAFAYDGLKRTCEVIEKIQGGLNKSLRIDGVLLAMMEPDPLSQHFAEILRREFGERVFAAEVPKDREVVKAGLRRLPAAVFNPRALSTQAYLDVAGELLARQPLVEGAEKPVFDRAAAMAELLRWQALPATAAPRPTQDGEAAIRRDEARERDEARITPPSRRSGPRWASHAAVALLGLIVGVLAADTIHGWFERAVSVIAHN